MAKAAWTVFQAAFAVVAWFVVSVERVGTEALAS